MIIFIHGNMIFQSLSDTIAKQIGEGISNYISSKYNIWKTLIDMQTQTTIFLEGSSDFTDVVVLSPDVQEKFSEMKYTISSILKDGVSRNALLSGPPGTSKTSILLNLAHFFRSTHKKHKYKITIIIGSFFAVFEESKAIEILNAYFNQVISDMKKGVNIFIGIDEGDALFLHEQNGKRSAIINTFASYLSQIERLGQENLHKKKKMGKCIIVFTTNHPELFPEMSGRRIGIHMNCTLPTLVETKQIIKNHIKRYFNKTSWFNIMDEFLDFIVTQIDGLTGGDIYNIIKNIYLLYASTNDRLKSNFFVSTKKLFEYFLDEYYKKLLIVGKKSEKSAKKIIAEKMLLFNDWISERNNIAIEQYNELKYLSDIIDVLGTDLQTLISACTNNEKTVIWNIRYLIYNNKYNISLSKFDETITKNGYVIDNEDLLDHELEQE